MGIQGRAEKSGGEIDDRDHPLIGHARGPDHTEHADHFVVGRIRRGDDAAIVQDLEAGFVADEDPHALGLEALIQEVQEVALFIERLEEPPQALDAGKLRDPHQVCLARDRDQGGADIALSDRTEVRLHPDHVGWTRGERSGSAEIAGWFAFRGGRPLDTLALLMVCDAFPPAVFNLDIAPGWVPTVEYTVHVRAVPAPGPLMCVFRTTLVSGGFLDEVGEVWDAAGRLVAQSRQLGLTPLS